MEDDSKGVKRNSNLELPCFILGLGAGVLLTLLYAPLSGEKTRRLISRRVQEGEDWVNDQASAAQDYVTSTAGGLRDKAREVAEVIAR